MLASVSRPKKSWVALLVAGPAAAPEGTLALARRPGLVAGRVQDGVVPVLRGLLAFFAAGLVGGGAAVLLTPVQHALRERVALRRVGSVGRTLVLGVLRTLLAVHIAAVGWRRAALGLAGRANGGRGGGALLRAAAVPEAAALDARGARVAPLPACRGRLAVQRDATVELVHRLRLAVVRCSAGGDAAPEVGARVQLAECGARGRLRRAVALLGHAVAGRLGGPGRALRPGVPFRDAVLAQVPCRARAPRGAVGLGGAVPAVHHARALGRVGGTAACLLAPPAGHARLELLLGVLVAVVAAVRRRLGAVLLDAVGKELLHERRACVGGMARCDALLGRGLRAGRAAILAGRLGGGLAVLAHAVCACVGRLVPAVRRRTAGVHALGEDAAGEVGAAVLTRLRRRVAHLLCAAVEGGLANRGALVRVVAFVEAVLLQAVRQCGAARLARRRRLVRAVRGRALEVVRLGGLGAALDRAALRAARLEGLLCLRAALLETGRAVGGRRRRRRAGRGALQVLRLGGLPALLERPASGAARLERRPGGGRALLDARRVGWRGILRAGGHRAQREREQRGGEDAGWVHAGLRGGRAKSTRSEQCPCPWPAAGVSWWRRNHWRECQGACRISR